MDDPLNNINAFDTEDNVDLKQEVRKFLRYWPWFVLTLIIAIAASYIYLRYAAEVCFNADTSNEGELANMMRMFASRRNLTVRHRCKCSCRS